MKPTAHIPRFELLRSSGGGVTTTLADDARSGLTSPPRSLPPKHFYDDVGSQLFDRICELPEYYLTRTERALLEHNADAIVERAGFPDELVELGSGMARKTGLLLSAMTRRAPSVRYVPIDIAESALEASARALLDLHAGLSVCAVVGDFQHELPAIRRVPGAPSRRLFAFLGSTIGNLDERAAPQLIAAVAAEMREGDSFLLGVDLAKDRAVLERAYDDAAGVTARFNRNVLTICNRELGADFDVDAFAHEAPFVQAHSRIEMHLRARSPQRVHLRELEMTISIAPGESILTEISRKFTRASVEATLEQGGMRLLSWMTPDDSAFALALARPR